MKQTLISLAAAAALSLTGLAITAFYLMGIYLFPGTLNELSLIFGMTVMISIGWIKYGHYLNDLQFQSLKFRVFHITRLFVVMGIYSMIIIFIDRSTERSAMPAHMWIILTTIMLLLDSILAKKDIWTGRVSHGITIMFFIASALYHNSLYIWLISTTYVIAMLYVSASVTYRIKKTADGLAISALVVALAATTVQFWSVILSVLLWLVSQIFLVIGVLIILTLFLLFFRKLRIRKKRKEEIRQRKIKQAMLKEQNDKIERRNEAALQNSIIRTIMERKPITFFELNSLNKESLMSVKKLWPHIVAELDITDLIEVSDLKKRIVWDQSVLSQTLQQLNYMFQSSQNDELLRLLIKKVKALIEIANKNYMGSSALLNNIKRDCNFANSFI